MFVFDKAKRQNIVKKLNLLKLIHLIFKFR